MNVTDRAVMLRGVLAGACLYAFGAIAPSALAQDAGAAQPPQTPPQPKQPEQEQPKKTDKAEKSARQDSVENLPLWESYGAGGEAGMEETFFRLARDFVMTSDEGIHPLGQVPIWPRGEFKIAGFRVLPFVREGVRWDHNYYRQPNTGDGASANGREAEWTHENEVGLMADTYLMGGRLGISTTIDSVWNVHYGHDAPADEWNFEGQIGARYSWPSGVWISGGYRYNRTHDPDDLAVTGSTDFGRSTHGAFFHMGFDRDIFFGTKLQFEFGVQTRDEAADDKNYSNIDRTETTVYAKASYPFLKNNTTRVFVLASEEIAKRDSDTINDGNTFSLNAGLEGSIPLREGEYRGLRGQVSVGFQHGLYENDTYTRGSQTFVSDDNRQDTTLSVNVALQYVMSPKTTTDLRYTREAEFTAQGGNYALVDRIEWSASHTFTRQLTGRIDMYYEHEDPTGDEPAHAITGTDIGNSANNVNREGGGVGVRYAVNEWMDIDVSANVENRNDNSASSYRNYEGILGFTFYLNALTPKARSGSSVR